MPSRSARTFRKMYKHKSRVVERRKEAQDRQAERDKRTPTKQLGLLFSRPGASLKESERLEKLEEAQDANKR
jgi:hypothetical protein